jgi:release factor glutamine methyltransferase
MIPITQWYLRKERTYQRNGIEITVWPGVFHPGFFSSTVFLLQYLERTNLKNKTLLELGCGTGFISIATAKMGADVTASDLSRKAIENTLANALGAAVAIQVVHSDLFEQLKGRRFDWIVINPPYYAKKVNSESELAWNCGEDFQYFRKLFSDLKDHLTEDGQVLMVLTKGCDIETILGIAADHDLLFKKEQTKRVLFDGEDYLFRFSM